MTQLPRNQKLGAATISGHSTRASSPALGSPGGSHQPERALPPLPCSLPANDSRNSWVESTLQQVATLALTCTLGLFLALVFLDVIITEVETPVLWPALAWLKPAVDRFLFLFYIFFVLPFRRLCFSYLVIPALNLCNEKHYFVVSSTSPSLPLLCFGFQKIEETYRCKKRNSQNFYQRKIKKASNLNDAKGSSKQAQKSLDQT